MSTSKAGIAIALITSALTAGFLWSRRSNRKPAAVETAQDTPEDLREEVRLLRSKVAQMEAVSTWRASMTGQLPESKPVPPAAVPPRQHMPDEAEYETQLEEKFQAEARDPTWSRAATGDAVRALSGDLPSGSKLGTIECRSNLCRVESSHDDLEAFQAFVRAALLNPDRKLWNGGFSAQVMAQSSSGVTAVTFIAREGYGIPAAEAMPD